MAAGGHLALRAVARHRPGGWGGLAVTLTVSRICHCMASALERVRGKRQRDPALAQSGG